MTRAVALVAVVVVAGVSGCADALIGTCVDDTACGVGTVCAFGLCVDANDPRLAAVDVEVEPVESSGLPQQSVFDIDTADAGGGRVDVTLVGGVRRSQTVKSLQEEGSSAVAATVQAVPLRSIPGRLRAPAANTDENGDFALTLLDGVDYSVDVLPQAPHSALYPPLQLTPVDDEDFLDADLFVVNVDPVFDVLRGRVINDAGPQSSLEVFVLAGARRVSTTSVTTDDGAFSLLLREVPPGAQLVVRPAAATSLPRNVAPNLIQPTVVIGIDAFAGEVDLGDISLGAVSGLSTHVRGTVTSSQGAVEGSVVTFHALVGAGFFAARVVTGADGSFELDLLPGDYSVAAVPPQTARAGLLVRAEPLAVLPATEIDALVLALPSRVDAQARITTNDGIAVSSASVTFERVGDVDGLAQPVLQDAQPVFVASADVDGNASVVVDRGRYRVKITPPRGSGAPGFSTLVSIDGNFTRDFVLPPPNVLAGVVKDSDGGATAGAFVRVFSHVTDEAGRAIFLGEAICGDDGAFEVSVPDLSP